MRLKDHLIARGYIPDSVIRSYVRRSCKQRNSDTSQISGNREEYLKNFVKSLSSQAIAIQPDRANQQHYEVNTQFFKTVLGPHMKYSACLWPDELGEISLKEAENEMLQLTCNRAQIENGMQILELGCGWGSLTLFMAKRNPDSRVTAVTNSSTQKSYIDAQAKKLKLENIRIIKADMNYFEVDYEYDRILSVEMFEHMRNWPKLLSRISNWLHTEGKVFLHFFAYKGLPYLYDANDPADWMAKNFFDAGLMPSTDLIDYCLGKNLIIAKKWMIPGTHYQKTLEAWLLKMDHSKNELYPHFEKDYGMEANTYWNHWRVFFMSCAEVFGYNYGKDWVIQHQLLIR